MNRSYVTAFVAVWMLAVAINSAAAQNRVQAGTLVCNTSMELGVIVGSREALNCTFTPSVPGSPADFGKLIAGEVEKWSKVVRFAGIKPE